MKKGNYFRRRIVYPCVDNAPDTSYGERYRVFNRIGMTVQNNTDAELMAKLRSRDMSALGELARRHQPNVLALAYRTMGNWDHAEDIAQEVFLKVYRAANRYKPTAKFSTWLYRVTLNLCIDHQRRNARRGLAVDSAMLENKAVRYPDTMETTEIARMVRNAILQLPERQRHALVLYRYQGLSHEEIGEVMKTSRSAVESLLVRAYANLRKKLAKLKDSA